MIVKQSQFTQQQYLQLWEKIGLFFFTCWSAQWIAKCELCLMWGLM